MSQPPAKVKLYHTLHVDRPSSITSDGELFCDAIMAPSSGTGTTIGMSSIKARRLKNAIRSHQGMHVGECVP